MRFVRSELAAPRLARWPLRSVMGVHGAARMSCQIDRQARSHRGGPIPARLALAKHDIRQQLPQLGSTIRQRHQDVQQYWLAVPIANPLAEAEDVFEAIAQPAVVLAQPCLVYARSEPPDHMRGGNLSGFECV